MRSLTCQFFILYYTNIQISKNKRVSKNSKTTLCLILYSQFYDKRFPYFWVLYVICYYHVVIASLSIIVKVKKNVKHLTSMDVIVKKNFKIQHIKSKNKFKHVA